MEDKSIVEEVKVESKVLPAKMKAIPFLADCKPEQLVIKEVDTPKITADDEVIVEVRAFGLNFADVLARKGQYSAAPPYPYVPGYEACGIVVAIGSKVDNVKVGQKVIAGCFNFGGYAQYCKTFKEGVMLLPESWSFSQGAGATVTSLTAYHSLFGTGILEQGDRVLIHACAGGVGLAALQLALHAKCEVFGTCGSEEKIKMLKDKGVHHPINYRTSDFEVEVQKITKGEGVDVIIDSVGGSYFKKDIKILRANGRVVAIGASSTADRSLLKAFSLVSDVISMTTLNGIQLLLGSKSFCGVNVKQLADFKRSLLAKEGKEIEKLYNSGVLVPEIHTELPWTEIGKGHQMLENRQSTGKIVMTIPVEGEKEKQKE